MLLSDAVKQVDQNENPEAAYIRLFSDQMQPDKFQRWFQIVRQVPADLIPKMLECAKLAPHDAFRMCYPDYVNVGEFINAVNESRKPQVAPEKPQVESQKRRKPQVDVPIEKVELPVVDAPEGVEGAI